MTEIAIYVEGGGDQRDIKDRLREGFGEFLRELRDIARRKKIRWKIVACGGREEAYRDFCTAIAQNPQAFNVLIVDAERSIRDGAKEASRLPWTHLKARDNWDCPPGASHLQCFLMVECMEAWLIADRANLQKYYGVCFAMNALPQNNDLESVAKDNLYTALKRATKNCKSEYHKTRHAFDILGKSDAALVRSRVSHCKRLFDVLAAQMGETI